MKIPIIFVIILFIFAGIVVDKILYSGLYSYYFNSTYNRDYAIGAIILPLVILFSVYLGLRARHKDRVKAVATLKAEKYDIYGREFIRERARVDARKIEDFDRSLP